MYRFIAEFFHLAVSFFYDIIKISKALKQMEILAEYSKVMLLTFSVKYAHMTILQNQKARRRKQERAIVIV